MRKHRIFNILQFLQIYNTLRPIMDNTDLCVTQIAKYAAVYNTRYIYTIYLLDTRYMYLH